MQNSIETQGNYAPSLDRYGTYKLVHGRVKKEAGN